MRGFLARNPISILCVLMVTAILCGHYLWGLFPVPPYQRPTANAWQQKLVERYQSMGLTGDALGTISALTLGYKGDLDRGVIQSFQRSGAAHVLAVSGLHTGIVYGLIVFLLTFGRRYKPLYDQTLLRCCQSALVLALLWCYAYLTGLTPSVVRSALMLSLFELARLCHRPPFSLNVVFLSMVLILAIRPTDLFNVSFQLSYSAVIAIVAFSSILNKQSSLSNKQSSLSNKQSSLSNKQSSNTTYIFRKLGRGTFNLVWVSLAAQLGTMPFTLYYFHQLSNYFLLTNLIVLPLATILVPLGLAVLALGNVPYLGAVLVWCLQKGTELMIASVDWVQSLPGAVVQF